LANTKSAEKAARNVVMRSRLRSALRDVTAAIASGKKDVAQTAYKTAVPVIDSMVTKGMIHKNKAARHKSRLAHGLKGLK
jgi:small subunit ribosomal protein S20